MQASTLPLIVIVNGPQWGQRVPLGDSGDVSIGRSAESALCIISDQRISKSHASIMYADGSYWLHDLGSRNGTWLRGSVVPKSVRLSHGDTFRCGSTELALWDPSSLQGDPAPSEVERSLADLLRHAAMPRAVRDRDENRKKVLLPSTMSGYDAQASSQEAPGTADAEVPESRRPVVGALQKIGLFRNLSQEQIARLAQAAEQRHYDGGAEIIRQGEDGLCMYSIIAGSVEVLRRSARVGSEQRLAKLGAGDFFGEMALFDAMPRSATVRATAPAECVLLSRWTVTSTIQSDPDFAMGLLEALSQRLRGVEDLI